MKRHNLIQGTPEWHQHRAAHLNASDVPAMMSCSPYRTRADLANRTQTGSPHILRRGHQIEAAQRERVASLIGETLSPAVFSVEVDGLPLSPIVLPIDVYGLPLSASVDGITDDGKLLLEVKTISKRFRAMTGQRSVPLDILLQIQQQLMITEADACLLVAASYDGEEVVEATVRPVKRWQQAIVTSWNEFIEDYPNFLKGDKHGITE